MNQKRFIPLVLWYRAIFDEVDVRKKHVAILQPNISQKGSQIA